MPFDDLTGFLSLVVVLLVSFPAHEMAHAYLADAFGDDTPRSYGRLTANPLAHIDPFGALMMLFAGFGWAKPVPVSEYALERHSRSAPMLVALAGPGANLGLALVGSILYKAFSLTRFTTFGNILFIFVFFNFVLFFFNLLPVFPLDGEKVLLYFLPYDLEEKLLRLRQYKIGPLLVFVLILPMLGINIVGWLVFNPASALTTMLLF